MLKQFTAKRRSAEQLETEQAKRLNTERTEDEHQCVNKAKLLKDGEWNQQGEHKAQGLEEKESTFFKSNDFLRITMLNGSSWGAVKDCMGRDKGHHDVFVGIEHRLRGDELVEMLNKASKRYKIAAGDARATRESEVVGVEISGGVFVDVANRLTSAALVGGVKFDGFEENDGRIAEVCVKCHQGIHVFAVYFWHSEGWTTRSEELVKAVLRRVANTKSLWIVACDANMEPRDFEFCDWYVKALASGVSFYDAKSADGKNVDNVMGYYIVSESLGNKVDEARRWGTWWHTWR